MLNSFKFLNSNPHLARFQAWPDNWPPFLPWTLGLQTNSLSGFLRARTRSLDQRINFKGGGQECPPHMTSEVRGGLTDLLQRSSKIAQGGFIPPIPSPQANFLRFHQSRLAEDRNVMRNGGLGKRNALLDIRGAQAERPCRWNIRRVLSGRAKSAAG